MSFAEAFLRLASALVGWLVVYAHCLTVAVAPLADCTQASGDPFRAALFTGTGALAFSLLIPLGRAVPGVGAGLRWLSLPALLLGALAARAIAPLLVGASFEGAHLCPALEAPPPGWHSAWVPFQFLTLVAVALVSYRVWRPVRKEPR